MKKPYKFAMLTFLAISLSACAPSAKEIHQPVLPDDLKDCKFYSVFDGWSNLKVARCPNSSTSVTYQEGKATRRTITIDGKEYEEVQK